MKSNAMLIIAKVQYHEGHCNSILRENNRAAVEWIDYNGE
jgi:hypothetical protein